MKLGPDYIYECPNCGCFLKRGSIISGNTFRSTLYSDGKRIAPMLREFPNLTKCRKCNSILWLSEMKKIGTCEDEGKAKMKSLNKILKKMLMELTDGSDPILESDTVEEQEENCKPEWKNAIRVDFLDITDLFRFLKWDTVKNDIEKEKYVRTHIWWTFNDRIRTSKGTLIRIGEKKLWEKNCRRLIELLDKTEDNQTITAAELYRNLGDFEPCMELLSSIKDEKYDWIVEKLKLECNAKNSILIEL